jgi:hypothetical protein
MTAKRNILAQETGISIRSFDYLTDMLRQRCGFLWTLAPHDEYGKPGDVALNQLANPFARAYSWRAWKQVVERRNFQYSHFVARNAENLLARRTYSREFETFLRWWQSLPAGKRPRYGPRPARPERLGNLIGRMPARFDR